MEYLGHIISFNGIAMDPSKISIVMRWPILKSIKGVRGFLERIGYYWRFICDYGTIAYPLTQLTTKEAQQKFHWIPLAQSAFNALKLALNTTPVLAIPDFSRQFELECDASGFNIGTILTQQGRPIAYFSKALSHKTVNSSAFEKELMAVALAIQH